MRAHDQSSIFSAGGKFHLDYGLLLELHAFTLVARSYNTLAFITLYGEQSGISWAYSVKTNEIARSLIIT